MWAGKAEERAGNEEAKVSYIIIEVNDDCDDDDCDGDDDERDMNNKNKRLNKKINIEKKKINK